MLMLTTIVIYICFYAIPTIIVLLSTIVLIEEGSQPPQILFLMVQIGTIGWFAAVFHGAINEFNSECREN
jgi:hypothetical protein